MNFTESVVDVLEKAAVPLTPQKIRDIIKVEHPEFYATAAQERGVEKGHYQNLDHALQARIYLLVRRSDQFVCDNATKPIKVSLANLTEEENATIPPAFEDLERDFGTVYVLGTNTFTKKGREIVKIGLTASGIVNRIDQLYSTSVPYRFRVIKLFTVKGFTELEKALHNLLGPFRLNNAREFFSEEVLKHIERIVTLHTEIRNGLDGPDQDG